MFEDVFKVIPPHLQEQMREAVEQGGT
jgi:hypothetical protein